MRLIGNLLWFLFGGLISGLLAEECALAGCVMICPPVRMRAFLRLAAFAADGIPYVRYEGKGTAPPDAYYNMYRGMSTKKLRDIRRMGKRFAGRIGAFSCPLLAIEAGRDNKVDPDTFRILREGVPGMTYRLFPDAPHGCTYGSLRESVADCVAEWIRERERDAGKA